MPPRNSATRGATVAGARLQRDRLGDESAEALEVHDTVELLPEAGGAGGEEQRDSGTGGRRRFAGEPSATVTARARGAGRGAAPACGRERILPEHRPLVLLHPRRPKYHERRSGGSPPARGSRTALRPAGGPGRGSTRSAPRGGAAPTHPTPGPGHARRGSPWARRGCRASPLDTVRKRLTARAGAPRSRGRSPRRGRAGDRPVRRRRRPNRAADNTWDTKPRTIPASDAAVVRDAARAWSSAVKGRSSSTDDTFAIRCRVSASRARSTYSGGSGSAATSRSRAERSRRCRAARGVRRPRRASGPVSPEAYPSGALQPIRPAPTRRVAPACPTAAATVSQRTVVSLTREQGIRQRERSASRRCAAAEREQPLRPRARLVDPFERRDAPPRAGWSDAALDPGSACASHATDRILALRHGRDGTARRERRVAQLEVAASQGERGLLPYLRLRVFREQRDMAQRRPRRWRTGSVSRARGP